MFASTSIVCSKKSILWNHGNRKKSMLLNRGNRKKSILWNRGNRKKSILWNRGNRKIMSSGINIKKFLRSLGKQTLPFFAKHFFYNNKFSELVVSFPSCPILYSRDCRAPRSHGPRFVRVHSFICWDCHICIFRASRVVYFLFIGNGRACSPRLHGHHFARSPSLIY